MALTNVDNPNVNEKTSSECDVLVVGAGPAGAAAAYYLACAGFRVTVLDQQRFPRERICADFVSPRSIKELEKIHVTDAPAFIAANVIDKSTIFLSGEALVSGAFPQVNDLPRYSRVMPRKVLDILILEAAHKAGAIILEGYRVSEYHLQKDSVTVTAHDGKNMRVFSAQLLIGADGNESVIARDLSGHEWSKQKRGLVARGYFVGVKGSPNEANVFFSDESFPGYSWIFPTGKHEANVGVGVLLGANPPTENPKELLTKLIESDAAMHSLLEHAKLKDEIEVSALNLHDSQHPIVGNRVILVGEAAGLVNPYNGEGMQMALLSGRWAAETAVACKGDYSEQNLSGYSKRVEDELGGGFEVSELMLGLVRNRSLNQTWLKWLELMGEKSKTDPEFARLTSGIVSGMIFPNRDAAAQAVIGTLQEAALSAGIKTFNTMLTDPSKLPQTAIKVAQTGLAVAQDAAQDPFSALTWGIDALFNVAGVAASTAKQALKDLENQTY